MIVQIQPRIGSRSEEKIQTNLDWHLFEKLQRGTCFFNIRWLLNIGLLCKRSYVSAFNLQIKSYKPQVDKRVRPRPDQTPFYKSDPRILATIMSFFPIYFLRGFFSWDKIYVACRRTNSCINSCISEGARNFYMHIAQILKLNAFY